MGYVIVSKSNYVASVTIDRPPVNALNEEVVHELSRVFKQLADDSDIYAVLLTGEGSFFSFGFDVPGFMDHSQEDFKSYVMSYSDLIRDIFMFDKPVIAAINGHSVAGGAVLALSCDYRVMREGKAKIALNEMTFGSSLFTSVTEFLRYAVGNKNAEKIVYSGSMYSAVQALGLGLIDQSAAAEEFDKTVADKANEFAAIDMEAFKRVKKLLKGDTLKRIERDEGASITEFVRVWYSDSTREKLAKIEIRG